MALAHAQAAMPQCGASLNTVTDQPYISYHFTLSRETPEQSVGLTKLRPNHLFQNHDLREQSDLLLFGYPLRRTQLSTA